MADARASEQDFLAVHNKIRRGDIIGIEGKPGKWKIILVNNLFIFSISTPIVKKYNTSGRGCSKQGQDNPGLVSIQIKIMKS